MEVYVELVILDNFTLTYLIASLTEFIMRRKRDILRIIVGAQVATIITLFYPLVPDNFPLLVVKIALFIVISLIFFLNRERFILSSLIFLGITFVFGGTIFALSKTMEIGRSETQIPLSLVLLSAIICYKIIQKLCVKKCKFDDATSQIYEFELKIFSRTIRGKALMDTGNRLYDEVTGLPVIIVSAKSFIEVLDDEKVSLLVSGRGDKMQKNARYMSIETVGGGARKILLLDAEEFSLYLPSGQNILYTVKLGVSFSPLNDSVKYDALLHPSLTIK